MPEAEDFLFVTKNSRRPRRFKTLDAAARFARELGLGRLEAELAN